MLSGLWSARILSSGSPIPPDGWTPVAFTQTCSANLPSPPGSPGAKEVVHYVFSQVLRRCPKYPAAVPLGHVVDEGRQPVVVGQHEDVQRGVPSGHLVHLGQRQLDCLRRGGPVEPRPAVPHQV